MNAIIEACGQYWWLPFILAAIIGLLTAWWIWGGKKDVSVPEPRVVEVEPPEAKAADIPAVKEKVAAPAAAAPLMSAPKAEAAPKPKAAAKKAAPKKAEPKKAEPKAKAAPVKKAAAKPVTAKAAAKTPAKSAVKPKAEVAAQSAPKAKAPAKPKAAAKPKPAAKPKLVIPDNLELLKGVGPKLNALLKSLGVTSFEQVANWTAADIRDVDSKLGSFAGRIGRDNWVDQAKLLVKGDIAAFEKKYGSLGSEIDRG
ncbi:hypothetical protein ACFOWX_12880 [Sphingorhabdus arenilitoris]|uniref:Uncharacterized protein n=1 Tax=Sphingorhabdus arenilitoris TaxID=1490041 RepID=A0ABV8RM13_9SPHN